MKIIASDFDGTLLRNGLISSEDINAIVRWRKTGNLFGLVTGRNSGSANHELISRGIEYDFLICNNGSAIYNSKNECIDAVTGDNSVLKQLVEYIINFNGNRAAISGVHNRVCVILDATPERMVLDNNTWIQLDDIESLPYSFTQIDTNAITCQNAHDLACLINTKLGNYVYAHLNGNNVDITPKGVDKPNGIYRLINMLNIDKDNVYVIGDNLNDLAMIREFNGFAVSSGNPAIISEAKKVYDSINDLIEDWSDLK